jgi:DNA-directed RNA polymerase subunit RPC12/RpoP
MIENLSTNAAPDISGKEQARIISEYSHKSKRLPRILVFCAASVFLGWGLAYIFPIPHLTPGDVFLLGIILIILLFSASIFFYYRCPKCRAPLPTKGIGASTADNDENCPKCGVRLK